MIEDNWARAKAILARELNIEAECLEDHQLLRDDLALDSIAALNLIFAFEKELRVTVTEDQVVKLQTVSDLRRLLRGRL